VAHEFAELSLPRYIDLGKFGSLKLAKRKTKCLHALLHKYHHNSEKGWHSFGGMNLGKMTLQLPEYRGGFGQTLDLKGLDVTFKIKKGADLDDLSAYKDLSISGAGTGRLKVFKGKPVDFRYGYVGLNFAKVGDKAKLDDGAFVAELPVGEYKIPNSKFRLDIEPAAGIQCNWKKSSRSWNDGRWDTKGLETVRLVYWLKGAALMTGQLKSSRKSGVTVNLKLEEDWGELPDNNLQELQDITATFVAPMENKPWTIEFDKTST